MSTALYDLQQEMKKFIVSYDDKSETKHLGAEALSEIRVYRGLVYNAVSSFVEKIYPLSYKLLKAGWKPLVKEYMKTHPPTSPVFNEVARAFPIFLKEKNLDPAYLPELAWYEWLELELYMMEDDDEPSIITPNHVICNFNYPITEIVDELQKGNIAFQAEPKAEQVLVYRDETVMEVRFLKLTPTTTIALQMLGEGADLKSVCEKVKDLFKMPDDCQDTLMKSLEDFVKQLKEKNILIS